MNYDDYWYFLTYKGDVGQPTRFKAQHFEKILTHLKEGIFSLNKTDFLKKSSMNILGTYLDVHIRVTQEQFSNKIAFTIRHRLKSLL